MNVEKLRLLFPITREAVYLNNASQSPLNTLVSHNLQIYLKTEFNHIDKKAFDRNTTKFLLANLLGGLPEEYALLTSTGVGIGIIAKGVNFKKGDNVVLPEYEHWNNTFPWLNLEKLGVQVRLVKVDSENRIRPEAFEKLVDYRTRVVAIAAVRYNSGFRPNLSAIGKIAHDKGALFVVDAAQAAGMIPIDVMKDEIDVMAGCGFKWLLGMHGTGFLYVSKRVLDQIDPVLPGMFAANQQYDKLIFHRDSRKFETGTIAYSLFNAWNAGLELIKDIGINNIYDQVIATTTYLIKGLIEKNYQIVTPINHSVERTGIVHFHAGSIQSTKLLYDQLTFKRFLVTLQGNNIRVSPNFFNTKDEIDAFLGCI